MHTNLDMEHCCSSQRWVRLLRYCWLWFCCDLPLHNWLSMHPSDPMVPTPLALLLIINIHNQNIKIRILKTDANISVIISGNANNLGITIIINGWCRMFCTCCALWIELDYNFLRYMIDLPTRYVNSYVLFYHQSNSWGH